MNQFFGRVVVDQKRVLLIRLVSKSASAGLLPREFLVEDEVEIALQVNGKVRDRITVPIAATSAELEQIALANGRVQEFTAGKTIRKVVVIPKKLVNVVAN